jgi:hypothetical protein
MTAMTIPLVGPTPATEPQEPNPLDLDAPEPDEPEPQPEPERRGSRLAAASLIWPLRGASVMAREGPEPNPLLPDAAGASVTTPLFCTLLFTDWSTSVPLMPSDIRSAIGWPAYWQPTTP